MILEYYYIQNNKKVIYKYKPTFNDFVEWFVAKYNISFLKAKEIVDKYIDHEQEMVFFDKCDNDLLVEVCYDSAMRKFAREKKINIRLKY